MLSRFGLVLLGELKKETALCHDSRGSSGVHDLKASNRMFLRWDVHHEGM
jgi:hypothetical protein